MQLMRAMSSYYRRNLHLLSRHRPPSNNPPFLATFHTSWLSNGNGPEKKREGKDTGGKEIAKLQLLSSTKSSTFTFSYWARWAFGSILALLLPFWSTQWQRLLRIEGEAEIAVKVVESAAEVVEQVATVTEKVSLETAEKLPEGGKLKSAALLVERVSEEVVEGAQSVEDIIHKVDELKQDVETLLKPVIGQDTKGKKAK